MSKKVFIVTGAEIAAYTATQQEHLLASLEALAQQYPEATIFDVTNYARQYLVIKAVEETNVVEDVVNPVLPEEPQYASAEAAQDAQDYPTETPVQASENVELNYYQPQVASEQTVYATDPNGNPVAYTSDPNQVVTNSEPVYDANGNPVASEQTGDSNYAGGYQQSHTAYDIPNDSTVSALEQELDNDLPPVGEDAQVAFRNNKFQGLFREASKLDI